MLTVCRRYLKRPEDAEEALLLGFAKVDELRRVERL